MFTIETPRLILRDLLTKDLAPFYALGSDPAILQFQTFIRLENEDQARQWLERAEYHNHEQPRRAYNLAILRKQDGQWLGWIGCGKPGNAALGDLDFGYALAPPFWGHGYMSEALRGLLGFCFRELGVQKIFGECDQQNPASARVMEKAGLRLELAYPEIDEATGKETQTLRYRILKEEWDGR